MKKNMVMLSGIVVLSACSNMQDITLRELFFGQKKQVQVVETMPIREITLDNQDSIIVTDTPFTFQLPKRADRFAQEAPLPEVYAIPAARATNRMLDETRDIYEQNGEVFLFITGLKKADRTLPDGTYKAEQVTSQIIKGSNTFHVTPNKEEADYILNTIIDNVGTPENPILSYRLILIDRENNKINEWVETVRRLSNDDRSWW